MSVTESSAWKWIPGMQYTVPESPPFTVSFVHADGRPSGKPSEVHTHASHHGRVLGSVTKDESSTWEPDLEDPATCGAIIFGIFEPLGIQVRKEVGVEHWTSRVHFPASMLDSERVRLSRVSRLDYFDSLADLIRAVFAVFAALDSEAGR